MDMLLGDFEATISGLRRMNARQCVSQVLNLVSIAAMAYMIWSVLRVYANCENPVVVVLSESMSPGFERGDLLFVSMRPDPVVAGDIVVFQVRGKEIPIVHRVLNVHERQNGTVYILTKGDNNNMHDEPLYAEHEEWLLMDDVLGRIQGYFPYAGIVTIIMKDYPKIKYLVLGVLGALVLVTRQQ